MKYATRPLSDRTWLRPPVARRSSPFSASWSTTLELLGREIDLLGGADFVIEVDTEERHIRLDGQLRADAKVDQPAIVVAFETKQHGSMLYRCDRYYAGAYRPRGDSWQHNVRAIALTLEALRAVDRYGATETGQQYTGFKAIGGGAPMPASSPRMTRDDAWRIVAELNGMSVFDAKRAQPAALIRSARAAAHPDRNAGNHDLAYRVDEAVRLLSGGERP